MSISRRAFLQLMGAAGVALAIPNVPETLAPLLPPSAPVAPTITPVGLRTIKIIFPDAEYLLQGYLRSQSLREPVDGKPTTDFAFTPSGPMSFSERKTRRRAPRYKAIPSQETTLLLDGKEIGTLTEIGMPRDVSNIIDITGDTGKLEYVKGIKRLTDLTFTCEFDGDNLL